MACVLHPHSLPSMNYFYIRCQPRQCMNPDAGCQPATSQPSPIPSLPPILPFSWTRTSYRAPAKNQARWCMKRGPSISHRTSSLQPRHYDLSLASHYAQFLHSISLLGCCWSLPVTCRSEEKNRCPNKFLSKRNYLGIRKARGGGEGKEQMYYLQICNHYSAEV